MERELTKYEKAIEAWEKEIARCSAYALKYSVMAMLTEDEYKKVKYAAIRDTYRASQADIIETRATMMKQWNM